MNANDAGTISRHAQEAVALKEREERERADKKLREDAQLGLQAELDRIYARIKEEATKGGKCIAFASGSNRYLNELIDERLRSEGFKTRRQFERFDDDGNGHVEFSVTWD